MTRGEHSANSQVVTIAGDVTGHWLGGDTLHYSRLRTIQALEAKCSALRDPIDEGRKTEPVPSVVLPLLEAAMPG